MLKRCSRRDVREGLSNVRRASFRAIVISPRFTSTDRVMSRNVTSFFFSASNDRGGSRHLVAVKSDSLADDAGRGVAFSFCGSTRTLANVVVPRDVGQDCQFLS